MVEVYISLGSNVERERHLRKALQLLAQHFGRLRCSSVYESEAVGFVGDPFFNLVVGVSTDADVYAVSRQMKDIERQCGRHRNGPRYSPRTLDLDLLLFGDLVIRENGLILPRDEITTQAFVLKPLAEVAGERAHPTAGQTYLELWDGFEHDPRSLATIDIDLFADR